MASPSVAAARVGAPGRRPSLRRRAAAAIALLAGLLALAETIAFPLRSPGAGLAGLVLGAATVACLWFGLRRHGLPRAFGFAGAVLALAALAAVLLVADMYLDLAAFAVTLAVALGARRVAFRPDRPAPPALPAAPRPRVRRRGVLLMNPRSGGGQVVRLDLAEQARRRGIEPVVLGPGDDLGALAHEAAVSGVDVIGMAGGDGSQALVAAAAAEHDLAYVCVPAGTRNHLALDLGVDRRDVVGALDAFVEAEERRIDLARVNGRVFVNNVSLGVYAKVVRSVDYRDAKVGTTLQLLPELLGPGAAPFGLRLRDARGEPYEDARLVLVSNNPYETTRIGAVGSRARMDEGVLGIIATQVAGRADAARLAGFEVVGAVRHYRGWDEWTAATFEVDADGPVEAGVDGEALVLDPPLRFESVPGALRVRVARSHPGASPAALQPRRSVRALGRIAVAR